MDVSAQTERVSPPLRPFVLLRPTAACMVSPRTEEGNPYAIHDSSANPYCKHPSSTHPEAMVYSLSGIFHLVWYRRSAIMEGSGGTFKETIEVCAPEIISCLSNSFPFYLTKNIYFVQIWGNNVPKASAFEKETQLARQVMLLPFHPPVTGMEVNNSPRVWGNLLGASKMAFLHGYK